MINKRRLIKLTRDLIRINSENPPGDEVGIAAFVKGFMHRLGVRVNIYEFRKNRSNVIATLRGRNPLRSLLITPHLDTVPQGKNWRFPAFSGKIHNDRIYGLGATDCKGNLAVSMEVINSLVEEERVLDYNLVFAATADEEAGSGLGLIPLLEKRLLIAHAAVVLDADEFDIIVAQKGLIHLKLKIQGKRAHGAYPWLGENAINIAAKIIRDLEKCRFRYRKNRLLKGPTVNAGTIHGGDKVNVVADWCEVELDFRFLPGTKAQDLLSVLRGIVKRYTRRFKIQVQGIQEPYEIDMRHPLVMGLSRVMRRLGIPGHIRGSEGATTITFFQRKNIPAVATGFGKGGCAHTIDEYASIDDLYKGAHVLEEFLKSYRFG
ncbi:MAG: M20 family metallopeptidase [Candidatus Omnitrophica bacterium]|nr:M20 family metallopeptidase [Candidatus Omnitrophota bacterium]